MDYIPDLGKEEKAGIVTVIRLHTCKNKLILAVCFVYQNQYMTEVIDTADPVLSYACGYNSHIAT